MAAPRLPCQPEVVPIPSPTRHLSCVVLGRIEGRSSGSSVALGHTAINDKVGSVDEATLVARKEEDTLSLLDGLAKAACGEVDFAAMALLLVVTKPVLQKRSAGAVSIWTSRGAHAEPTSVVLGTAS